MEVPLPIGKPAKSHHFDCVSEDGQIIVECKCYTWTNTGNITSCLVNLSIAFYFVTFYAGSNPDTIKKSIKEL